MFDLTMIEEARSTGRGHNLFVEVLKMIGVFVVISMLAQVLGSVLIILAGGHEDDLITTVGLLWAQLFCILGVALYCKFVEKRSLTSVGFVKKDFWKQYLKGLVTGFAMFAAVVLVGTAIGAFRFVGLSDNFNFGIYLLFFGGFVMQGMSEEVMCRGYFMVSMARKSSVVVAVIGNALLFAVMHAPNNGFGFFPCVNLILFAVFASIYTLKTGNIWAVSAFHSIWNFSQGCIFGLSVSGMELLPTLVVFESTDQVLANGGAFGPEGGFVVTIVLLVEIITMLIPLAKTSKNNV